MNWKWVKSRCSFKNIHSSYLGKPNKQIMLKQECHSTPKVHSTSTSPERCHTPAPREISSCFPQGCQKANMNFSEVPSHSLPVFLPRHRHGHRSTTDADPDSNALLGVWWKTKWQIFKGISSLTFIVVGASHGPGDVSRDHGDHGCSKKPRPCVLGEKRGDGKLTPIPPRERREDPWAHSV